VQGNKPYFYHLSARKSTVDIEFDIANLDTLPQIDIVYGYANMGRTPVDAVVAACLQRESLARRALSSYPPRRIGANGPIGTGVGAVLALNSDLSPAGPKLDRRF
jgi:hypothetical protein